VPYRFIFYRGAWYIFILRLSALCLVPSRIFLIHALYTSMGIKEGLIHPTHGVVFISIRGLLEDIVGTLEGASTFLFSRGFGFQI
jgi:hypothetical protein